MADETSITVLDSDRGKGKKTPYRIYVGLLQSGGQAGIFRISTRTRQQAHARRKFHEAKFTDKKRAEHALMLYSKLYGVESYCKEMSLSFDQRKQIRQEKSVPVFNELDDWVREEIPRLTTLRSPIGKAIPIFLNGKSN